MTMSGFWIILISLGYVIVSGVVYGLMYRLTKDELDSSVFAFLWPTLLIAIPIAILSDFIVGKICGKEKENE